MYSQDSCVSTVSTASTETAEMKMRYDREWTALNLQSICSKHPDKNKAECLELLFVELLFTRFSAVPDPLVI